MPRTEREPTKLDLAQLPTMNSQTPRYSARLTLPKDSSNGTGGTGDKKELTITVIDLQNELRGGIHLKTNTDL